MKSKLLETKVEFDTLYIDEIHQIDQPLNFIKLEINLKETTFIKEFLDKWKVFKEDTHEDPLEISKMYLKIVENIRKKTTGATPWHE